MHILLQQFLFISFLAAVLHLSSIKSERRDVLFMVLVFIPMWYIRSMVDINTVPDLGQYEKMFRNVKYMSWLQSIEYEGAMEAGYVTFNKFISLMTSDFRVFLCIWNFLLLFLYFHTFRKYSPYVVLSVIILLVSSYNISIYVLRQYFVVAIFVASFPLIVERKMVPFLMVCLFSSFIHKTAILCVPIYFIYSLKPKLMMASIVAFSLLIFFAADALIIITIETINDYHNYLETQGAGQSWVPAARAGMELGLFTYLVSKKIWDNDFYKLVFVLLAMYFLVNVIIIGRDGTLSRVSTYYGTATLFALPIILKEVKDTVYKVGALFVILFLKIYPIFFGSTGLGDLSEMRLVNIF